METTKKISVNIIGTNSGNPYTGDVILKTIITREEGFIADAKRREILGPQAQDAIPDRQSEAFMLGQLFVRILEAPVWWNNTRFGRDLYDLNVIVHLWNAADEAEKARQEDVKAKATAALAEMGKDQEKANAKKAK